MGKAYEVNCDLSEYTELVYADNATQAKLKGHNTDNLSEYDYIELRAKRVPSMDDTEHLSWYEQSRKLILEEGWWFDDGRFTEDNIDDFDDEFEPKGVN